MVMILDLFQQYCCSTSRTCVGSRFVARKWRETLIGFISIQLAHFQTYRYEYLDPAQFSSHNNKRKPQKLPPQGDSELTGAESAEFHPGRYFLLYDCKIVFKVFYMGDLSLVCHENTKHNRIPRRLT